MYIYSQLRSAQLENKSSNYSAGVKGRIWHNTTDAKSYLDNGTVVRAFLLNDDKAILGNHATAANNIRFHRGASAVLQFVLGDDATAEGSLSTSLAQISARLENYTTGALPSPGQTGRMVFDTSLGYPKYDNGVAWQGLSGAAVNQYDAVVATPAITNLSTQTSIATAIGAVSAGDEILVMNNTFSENVNLNKQLSMFGQGYSSVIAGNLTISANNCCVEKLRVTGSLIVNGTGNVIDKLWMPNGAQVTVAEGNYVGVIMYY
jgi:hypothetical protein